MEFLRIGEAKIKIIMSDEELKRYGLTDVPDCGPSCRRAIWQVLDIAKGEVGFDPAGDKILVQFYPLKGSGCELFITKLGILAPSSVKLVSKSDKVTMLSRKQSYYLFDSLDELRLVAREIMSRTDGTPPRSDVYSEGDIYILSIEEYGRGGEISEYPCISEFGRLLSADVSLYVCEHFARLTDGDAIAGFLSTPQA